MPALALAYTTFPHQKAGLRLRTVSHQLYKRNPDRPSADKGQTHIEATQGFVVLIAPERPKGSAQDGPIHSGLTHKRGRVSPEEPTCFRKGN